MEKLFVEKKLRKLIKIFHKNFTKLNLFNSNTVSFSARIQLKIENISVNFTGFVNCLNVKNEIKYEKKFI
jgi:hypothetical protein